MFRKSIRIVLMIMATFSIAFVVACAKEKKRTEVHRKGKAKNSAGKASPDMCKKEKKLLSLDGNKCIAKSECKDSDNVEEKDGKCLCKDGYQPDDKKTACVKRDGSGSQPVPRTNPRPNPPSPKPQPTPNKPGTDTPLEIFKSGDGQVNIQCASKEARIESLNLKVKTESGDDLELGYTMAEDDKWFDETQAHPLKPAEGTPVEATYIKIVATCMQACAAVKFAVTPAKAGEGNATSMTGVFYGVPDKSCKEDPKSADARPMTLQTQKPVIK